MPETGSDTCTDTDIGTSRNNSGSNDEGHSRSHVFGFMSNSYSHSQGGQSQRGVAHRRRQESTPRIVQGCVEEKRSEGEENVHVQSDFWHEIASGVPFSAVSNKSPLITSDSEEALLCDEMPSQKTERKRDESDEKEEGRLVVVESKKLEQEDLNEFATENTGLVKEEKQEEDREKKVTVRKKWKEDINDEGKREHKEEVRRRMIAEASENDETKKNTKTEDTEDLKSEKSSNELQPSSSITSNIALKKRDSGEDEGALKNSDVSEVMEERRDSVGFVKGISAILKQEKTTNIPDEKGIAGDAKLSNTCSEKDSQGEYVSGKRGVGKGDGEEISSVSVPVFEKSASDISQEDVQLLARQISSGKTRPNQSFRVSASKIPPPKPNEQMTVDEVSAQRSITDKSPRRLIIPTESIRRPLTENDVIKFKLSDECSGEIRTHTLREDGNVPRKRLLSEDSTASLSASLSKPPLHSDDNGSMTSRRKQLIDSAASVSTSLPTSRTSPRPIPVPILTPTSLPVPLPLPVSTSLSVAVSTPMHGTGSGSGNGCGSGSRSGSNSGSVGGIDEKMRQLDEKLRRLEAIDRRHEDREKALQREKKVTDQKALALEIRMQEFEERYCAAYVHTFDLT